MKVKTMKSRNMLIAAVCSTVACLLQVIGLIRYLSRLPDDWVGIGLYIATIVAFALGAIGFYGRWAKE
jgi:hypothetical protein